MLRAIADAMTARFGAVTVQGELASFTRAPSGHCYFSLKDDRSAEPALIRGAMFRRSVALLDFSPREGQLVEIRGRLAVYDARGDLQLVAEAMRPAGQGALYEQFLRLKARLEAQGLFDAARKRALPAFPSRLAVVTSLNAAALHDVLTALARRAPQVEVVVVPTSVQGVQAPGEIVEALVRAGTLPGVDAVLLCRGGGSLEDLWAFNDERVAHAIAGCAVPVICGVGHETDFTIADFVADLRAPTPTAAAELAAPVRDELLDDLAMLARRLQQRVQSRLEREAQRLDHAALRLARPAQVLSQRRRQLDLLGQRLQSAPARRLALATQQQAHLASRLQRAVGVQTERTAQRLDGLHRRLEALSPRQVLARGYAYLTDLQGQALVSVQRVQPDQSVQAVLSDGRIVARVNRIEVDPDPTG